MERFLSSLWRHAVFEHDYGETFESFPEKFTNFRFGDVAVKFSRHFPVHEFDMDAPDYVKSLETLIQTELEIPHANIGVPLDFAKLLQRNHSLLGTEKFQIRFDYETKVHMLEVWKGNTSVEIKPPLAILF